MKSSTAEFEDSLDHFGQRIESDRRAIDAARFYPGAFGGSIPYTIDGFDGNAARLAGRFVAARVSKKEFDALIEEHGRLVDKKISKEATNQDLRRLTYVRWNLDRIEDALHGEGLTMIEEGVM